MNKSVIFKSPSNSISGYSKIIDLFIRNFYKENIDLYLMMENFDDKKYQKYIRKITKEIINNSIEFVVCPLSTNNYNKNYLLNPNSNCLKYIFTMWESTNLEYGISKIINQINNTIIVPSEWNKINFLINGISCPIHTVPLGINDEIFFYKPPHNNSKFIFGCGEGQSQLRKRLNYTIECFCKAFPPKIKDVELHVKIDYNQYHNFPKYTDNRIKIIFEHIPEEKMIGFYENIDVFVSLAYSEGWGLMQHEAMMCGRPVMSTNYGGITEFFDSDVGIELQYNEELSGGMYASTNGFWASVIEKDVIEKLRYCYNNRNIISNKGLLSHNKVKHLT
jgi:glycosyltransferase involved in cell wall biosynthesis